MVEEANRIITVVSPGDVVQINERMGDAHLGWIGAFLLVTEVGTWGVQGFVHVLEDPQDLAPRAYIRLKSDQFDYIGKAVLIPEDLPLG